MDHLISNHNNSSIASNVTTAIPAQTGLSWDEILLIILSIPISAVAIIGNSLAILTIVQYGHLHTPFYICFINLSIAYTINGFDNIFINIIIPPMNYWTIGRYFCWIFITLDDFTFFEVLWTLVVILHDRIFAAKEILVYKERQTVKVILKQLIIKSLLIPIFWIPEVATGITLDDGNKHCLSVTNGHPATVIFRLVIGIIVPICLIVYTYVRLLIIVKRRIGPCRKAPLANLSSPINMNHDTPSRRSSGVEGATYPDSADELEMDKEKDKEIDKEFEKDKDCDKEKEQEIATIDKTVMTSFDNIRLRQENLALATCHSIILTYFCCFFLQIIVGFIIGFTSDENLPTTILNIFSFLINFCAFLNPFIFGASNPELRQVFRNVFKI